MREEIFLAGLAILADNFLIGMKKIIRLMEIFV